MDKVTLKDELFAKAFRLAWFIHCDKEIATQVASEALSKLEVACAAQDKRLYYTPTGRPSSRVARTKVSMGEPHLLQRLVYISSDERERRKEQTGQVTDEEMTIHYIKHLVRITTKRNSFYVALGLSRLLHSYSTMEAARIYGVVVQDPDRVRDDYYYRSRKGCLMRELKDRFGSLISVVRGQRGEERFQTQETSMKIRELIKDCLRAFTPWNTPCVVPEGHDPLSDTISSLSFDGDDPDQEHEVEVNRMHAILDPGCFERLTDSLALELPEDRLGIPYFSVSDSGSGRGGDRNNPPDPDDDELEAVRNLLAQESARRRVAAAGLMKVMVDGHERARFDPRKAGSVKFEVSSEAELIEVRSSDEKGEVTLAALIADFESAEKSSITLEGGQMLSFATSILRDSAGDVEGATIEVAYQETSLARAALLGLSRLVYQTSNVFSSSSEPRNALWKPVLAVGLVALLIGGLFFSLWLGGQQREENQIVHSPENAPVQDDNDVATQPNQAQNQSESQDKKTNPDQPPDSSPRRTVSPSNDNLIARNTTPDGRSPQTDPNKPLLRSTRPIVPGATLTEVARIRVEVTGEDQFSRQVEQILAEGLKRSGRFSVVDSIDTAQALLKVNAIEGLKDGQGTLIVRLVNESGYVLWPAKTTGSGAKYVGAVEELGTVIINDLLREAAKQGRGIPVR